MPAAHETPPARCRYSVRSAPARPRVRLGDAAECVFHVPRLGAHREDDTHRAARGAEQIGSKQRQKDDYGADAVHLPVEEPGEGAEKYRPAPGSGSVGSDAHPLVDVKIGLGVRTEEGCEIGADLRVSALHPAAQLLADVVDCDAHGSPPPVRHGWPCLLCLVRLHAEVAGSGSSRQQVAFDIVHKSSMRSASKRRES